MAVEYTGGGRMSYFRVVRKHFTEKKRFEKDKAASCVGIFRRNIPKSRYSWCKSPEEGVNLVC